MDGKKEYRIEINGVAQSISQVDALMEALKNLDNKLKELESRNINVSSTQIGNRNADLETESKVLKEIEKTEAQIAKVRSEDYQYLLQQKDAMKEASEAAKERAAAERLASNSYANTMKGVKQELSDIKKVMQNTEIGSEAFNNLTKRAGELTSKLKDLETAYGQFGRNVGNYASAAEGFNKLKIEVNGTVREFDNARQALKELTNERNTLSLLGEDFGNLDEVVKTLKSDIKDMETSSKAMDTLLDSMQSLLAMGSTAKGLAALFGFDDSEIEKSIQKLVALQNVLQGIEVIKKQMQTNEGLGGLFSKANTAIDNFSNSLFKVSTNAKVAKQELNGVAVAEKAVGTAAKGATIAAKALSAVLKTVGFGLVIAGISALLDGIDRLISSFKKVDKEAENLKKINEAGIESYAKAKTEIMAYRNRVNDFNGTLAQEKKLVQELNSKFGETLGTYKKLSEWQKVLTDNADAYCYSMLMEAKAQAALNLVTEAYANLQKTKIELKAMENNPFLSEAARIKFAALAMVKATGEIAAATAQYKKIWDELVEFNKEHSLGDFAPQIKTNGDKTVKSVKEIEEEISKARIDGMKAGLTKTIAQLLLERNKRIAEAKKTGKLVNEQIEQINRNYNQRVFEARVVYHETLLKEEREFWEQIETIQQQSFDRQVEYSRKMNEKRLQDALVTAADINDLFKVNALTLNYNSGDVSEYLGKYNKEAVKAYINTKLAVEFLERELPEVGDDFENLSEEAKQYYQNQSRLLDEARNQLQLIETEYEGVKDFVEKNLKIVTERISEAYAIRSYYRKEYYKTTLEATKKAADKELEIERERLESELLMEQKAEKERNKRSISDVYDRDTELGSNNISRLPQDTIKRYREMLSGDTFSGKTTDEIATMLSTYREAMDEWLSDLESKLDEGKITWDEYLEIVNSTALKSYKEAKTNYEQFLDEYNRMSDADKAENQTKLNRFYKVQNQEFVKYLDRVVVEQDTHNNVMKTLENKYNAEIEQAERDRQAKRQQATADYYSNLINENESALAAINTRIDNAERTNALGIINYKATKKELNELRKTVDQVVKDIEKQWDELIEKLRNEEISFEEFDTLISQLKTIRTQTQEASMSIDKSIKELFTNTMQSINNIAQNLGQSLSSLITALGDYTDVQYENQINALDRFIQEYEEKLDEQREITQQHSNEVNEIEDALATARGDRRDHLIDKLNAEMDAQRASLAQQKKLEKEKQKMEAKREETERKRFEQQKNVQTKEAIMSGALAVTNALSVNPIWVGIAMAAMTAAMTAVQVATIKAQKYADGGVIQGKSHSQGGVKVLGGRAEVEGGEYITNKVTTSKNVDLLEFINTKRKRINLEDLVEFYGGNGKVSKNIQTVRTKFADGGVVPTLRTDISINDRLLTAFEDYSKRPTLVSVVDIIDKTKTVNDVMVMAGIEPNY